MNLSWSSSFGARARACWLSLLLGAGLCARTAPSSAEQPAAGGGAAPAAPASDAAVGNGEPSAAADPRDAALLGDPAATNAPAAPVASEQPKPASPAPPDDPLRIGGLVYLRSYATLTRGERAQDMAFGTPMLLDVYLDARPSDRVRGFALGRIVFDPTLPASTSGVPNTGGGQFNGVETSARPQGLIDQLWLNFDIGRRVFVTAGKQHVRWGTAHVWTPTDYLHLRPRNPLDTFDARTGRTMLKLHVPVESKAWNFYAYAVTENERGTVSVGRIAAAARAELTFGTTEAAVGVFAQQGILPKFAADLSTGLGDFDLYGEAAILDAGAIDRTRWDPNAVIPAALPPPSWQTPDETAALRAGQIVEAVYPTFRNHGYRAQIVAGAGYSIRYNDSDSLNLGAEYFYNQLGYSDTNAYPGLFLPRNVPLSGSATFFYLGRHYGALFASLPAPFSWDLHNFSVTTLGNFSDQSFITRFDYSYTLLTHLTFEAFTSLRYGKSTGEFPFGVAPVDLDGATLSLPPTLLDLGIGLRLSI